MAMRVAAIAYDINCSLRLASFLVSLLAPLWLWFRPFSGFAFGSFVVLLLVLFLAFCLVSFWLCFWPLSGFAFGLVVVLLLASF